MVVAFAFHAGGIVIGVLEEFQSTSFRHLAAREEQALGYRHPKGFVKGTIDFWDFLPVQIHFNSGTSLTVIGLYLEPSSGFGVTNRQNITHLMAFLEVIQGPWLVLGDFNMTPREITACVHQLVATHGLQHVRAAQRSTSTQT